MGVPTVWPPSRRHRPQQPLSRGWAENASMNERVCVVVRVRPLTPAECRAGQPTAWAQSHDSIWPTLPRPLSAIGVDRPMGFDRVFGPDASNRAMYDELVHDRVERVLQASAGGVGWAARGSGGRSSACGPCAHPPLPATVCSDRPFASPLPVFFLRAGVQRHRDGVRPDLLRKNEHHSGRR